MFEARRTARRTGRISSYPKSRKINLSLRKSRRDNLETSKGKERKENIHQSSSPYLTHYKSVRPQIVENCCRTVGPASNALINNIFETINDMRDEEEDEEDEEEEEEDEDDDNYNYNDDDNYVDNYEKDDDDDDDEYNDAIDDIDDDEEDDHSDTSSEDSNFLEKLDEYMNKFRIDTDIDTDDKVKQLLELEALANKDIVKPVHLRSPNSRRKSILPGSEMCKEVLIFNGTLEPNQNQVLNTLELHTSELPSTRLSDNCVPETAVDDNLTNHNSNSLALPNNTSQGVEVLESIQELKMLVLNNAINQMQLNKIETNLEGAFDHYFEFSNVICLKARLIRDIQMNFDVLQGAKEKFENQRKELKQKVDKVCKQLETKKVKKNLKQVDLYEGKRLLYEDRLEDIENLSQIIDDSVKAISTLFDSIAASKEEETMLRAQMRKEEERKEKLKKQLEEDEKKILQLAEKLNVTPTTLREMHSEGEGGQGNNESKSVKNSLLEISEKLSHLDYVLKEKSMDLERTTYTCEKDDLRDEIRHLRRTRDRLLDEKCDLDEKFQKERTLSNIEERKRLEFGEAIEAIDAMIEHKNEMICGKKDFNESQSLRERGETMLMERLAKLSDGEMRTLFYKYFLKVIDLKESSQSLELRTAELETVIEAQKWRVQTLTNALKLTKLAGETNFATLQDQYQRDLLLIFKHFSQETSSSEQGKDSKVAKCKRKNERLTKLLGIYKHAVDTVIESNHVPSFLKDEVSKIITSLNIPLPTQVFNDQSNQGYKNTTTTTTKVTRQRNKLIIQKTTDSDKKKK